MSKRIAIVLCSLLFVGCPDIWSASADGKVIALCKDSTVLVTGPDLEVLERYPFDECGTVEISPDGSKLAVNLGESLWLIDRKAGTRKSIAKTPESIVLFNGWSPGSDKLAFFEEWEDKAEKEYFRLKIYDVKDGKTKVVDNDTAPVFGWSPDGKRHYGVKVLTRDKEDFPQLGVVGFWTGEAWTPLTRVAGFAYLQVLSDEELLLATADVKLPVARGDLLGKDHKPVGLYKVSTATGELKRLVKGEMQWFFLSPDKKRFVGYTETGPAGKRTEVIALYDISGRRLRTVRKLAPGTSLQILPFWAGPENVVLVTATGDKWKFEVFSVKTPRPKNLSGAFEALK